MLRPASDPFGARASLGSGLRDIYRLDAVAAGSTSAAPPVTVKILLENLLRHAGGGIVTRRTWTLLAWRPGAAAEAEIPFMPARVLLQDFTGVPAVVDLAVMRDAMAALGGDPAGQSAGAGRPGHRPLGPGRPLRDARRLRLQRRARIRAQRRALPAPALGPDRVPRPARRAARHGHRPPGQPRVPGDGRRPIATDGAAAGRLPGHAGRDGFAHDDGQRPGCPGLRRGRHRSGGRPPGPAALPADAPRRRRPTPRHAAAGSTATDLVLVVTELLRATASSARSSSSPGTGWPALAARRSGDDQQHEPRVRGDRHALPDRRRDARLPAPDRAVPERLALVERYAKEQGLWREPGDGPVFDELLELDLATVEPSVAGPVARRIGCR